VCESVIGKPPHCRAASLVQAQAHVAGPVPDSARFTSLGDTDNGDRYSRGMSVANCIGYRVAEAVSG
jgi:hypothetical protein